MQDLLLHDSLMVSHADSYVVPLATSSVPNTFVIAKLQSGFPAVSLPWGGGGANISTKIKTREIRKDLTHLLGRKAGPKWKHNLLPKSLQSSEFSFTAQKIIRTVLEMTEGKKTADEQRSASDHLGQSKWTSSVRLNYQHLGGKSYHLPWQKIQT